jgi:4-hydroxybenzoate polyprenyltransferase
METDILALMIPIIAIVMGIGIGMLAIYLGYRKRRELFAHFHQERMAAIEKGIECPPWPDSLLADQEASSSPRRHLLNGLVWLFIGVTGGVAVYATVAFRWALFGLVPIGIGAAHLIYYFVEGRKEAEAAEQTATVRRA